MNNTAYGKYQGNTPATGVGLAFTARRRIALLYSRIVWQSPVYWVIIGIVPDTFRS